MDIVVLDHVTRYKLHTRYVNGGVILQAHTTHGFPLALSLDMIEDRGLRFHVPTYMEYGLQHFPTWQLYDMLHRAVHECEPEVKKQWGFMAHTISLYACIFDPQYARVFDGPPDIKPEVERNFIEQCLMLNTKQDEELVLRDNITGAIYAVPIVDLQGPICQ